MLSRLQALIQPRHMGLACLAILAWAYMALFRYDNYGIEEGAALALLINWSIIHQIASPVALFGIPDLRAIFFVPLDLHWAGSLAAAKVFTMFTLFGTGLMLYRWSEREHSSESAMIATALLLIAPISLMQTDAIGSGVYLLFCFAAATWLMNIMEQSDHSLPSWFFLLLLITAMAISMHPMGLAIPFALGWRWWQQSKQEKQGKRLIVGLALTTAIMLFLRWGWHGMEAGNANPLMTLSDIILGSPLLHLPNWGIGLIIGDLLLITIGIVLFRKVTDALSLMLIAASLIGAVQGNHAWALIAWTTTLFLGIPLLIEANERWGWRGLTGQRGLLLLTVVVIASLSMAHDRQLALVGKHHLKNDTDMVIAVLEKEASDTKKTFLAASQWPARTLLACRRDVLPLPPASEDIALFRKQTKGLTHMAFNPQDESLHQLARNAAALSNELETIALLPGGVVLKAKQPPSQ